MPDQKPQLPVGSLTEALPFLRRPFTPEAVKFKVQSVFKDAKGCVVVGYIDARLVIERLNMVAGHEWSAIYKPVEGSQGTDLRWCGLRVYGVTRWDVGEGQGVGDGMRLKATVSDALKRAAVHFGIGVSIYALPQITLWANQPHVERIQGSKGPTLKLTEQGHAKLREGYAKWLAEHGTEHFGEPLSHGDVEGATVDPDAEVEVERPPEATPAQRKAAMTPKAKALLAEANEVYSKVGEERLPEARFQAFVQSTGGTEEGLQRMVDWLREQVPAGDAA
jgi:Rad52/22 family double-strand break repair protein